MIKVVKNIIYISISDIHLIENLNDGPNKNITHKKIMIFILLEKKFEKIKIEIKYLFLTKSLKIICKFIFEIN